MPAVDGSSVSSRWTYWLRNSNIHTVIQFSLSFCLHAILHDAVGALYAEVDRGTAMCLDVDPVPVFFGSHHGTSSLRAFEGICTLYVQSV